MMSGRLSLNPVSLDVPYLSRSLNQMTGRSSMHPVSLDVLYMS